LKKLIVCLNSKVGLFTMIRRKKTKLKFLETEAVDIGRFTIESWLKVKKYKRDMKCSQCGNLYEDILIVEEDNTLSLLWDKGLYKHICNVCAKRYVDEMNVKDVAKERKEKCMKRENILTELKELLNEYYPRKYYNLDDQKTENLEEFLEVERELKKKRDWIASLPEADPGDIDQYLIDEYNCVYDPKWLKDECQIEEYFKDNGYDYFDCGQGYSQNESNAIVKICDKYYSVDLYAEIESAKQDRGDRLYWVEDIERVEYKEIEKPIKKERKILRLELDLNVDEEREVEEFMQRFNCKVI